MCDMRAYTGLSASEGLTQLGRFGDAQSAHCVGQPHPGAFGGAAHQSWSTALSRGCVGRPSPRESRNLNGARRRLAFEEVFVPPIGGACCARATMEVQAGRRIPTSSERTVKSSGVPFPLTVTQTRSVARVLDDLASGARWKRLAEGDVGTGKTAVAAFLLAGWRMLAASRDDGAEPRSSLEQHFKSLSQLFVSGFPDPRPTSGLLRAAR